MVNCIYVVPLTECSSPGQLLNHDQSLMVGLGLELHLEAIAQPEVTPSLRNVYYAQVASVKLRIFKFNI